MADGSLSGVDEIAGHTAIKDDRFLWLVYGKHQDQGRRIAAGSPVVGAFLKEQDADEMIVSANESHSKVGDGIAYFKQKVMLVD